VSTLDEEIDGVIASVKRGAKNASALVSAFARKQAGVWWVAERLMPKKYGARLNLNHSGSVDLAGRLQAARERMEKGETE
jgi:hypothetical protein